MNPFVSAIPWYGWLILLPIPPLILLLYFLKLRRTPLEVPSTYLWTRTIEDLHVNSIWQRLRNSLLLILQLCLAGLLLLACLQPGCEGKKLVGDRFIFLLDQSGSMSAADLPDGSTRLEKAKADIDNLIDAMPPSATAMIISFSDESDVVQSYTRNKSLLRRKLASIEPTQRATDMTEALTAASGLANPGRTSDRESAIDIQVADARRAKLFIFSDGGVADVPGFSLGNLEAEYRPIGSFSPPDNVGITAFSISRDVDTESGVQAFMRLQNSHDEDHQVNVRLMADDRVFDAQRVQVPGEKSAVLSFDLTPLLENFENPIAIEVRIEHPDVYELDNVAYGVIDPPTKVRVLICSPANDFLRLALQTDRIRKLADVEFQQPNFTSGQEYLEKSSLGGYDLVIFDRCAPATLPQCNTLFLGSLPPGDEWSAGGRQFPTEIIDSAVSHPLMNSVNMQGVTIVEGVPLSGPQGFTSLLDSTYGSVMGIAPRSGFQDVVLGFTLIEKDDNDDTVINSDWPNKLSFPLFMQNAVTWLGGASRFNASRTTRPGQLIRFRTAPPVRKCHGPLACRKRRAIEASERQFIRLLPSGPHGHLPGYKRCHRRTRPVATGQPARPSGEQPGGSR